MALLPEVHVNFDQLTFERVYQIFLPLLPGGTLVGGLIVTYPQRVHDVALTLSLGRYTRVAVPVCGAYIAGLILYGFSAVITGICSTLMAHLASKLSPRKRPNETSSKSTVWRRVAIKFLGESLSPLPPLQPALPFEGNDVQWEDFYNVLQDYVLRGRPVLSNEIYLLFTYLQATGWVLFYLYWKPLLRGHWSVMVLSVPLILFGLSMPFGSFFQYYKFDRLSPWDFTARLINEIEMREKSAAAPQ